MAGAFAPQAAGAPTPEAPVSAPSMNLSGIGAALGSLFGTSPAVQQVNAQTAAKERSGMIDAAFLEALDEATMGIEQGDPTAQAKVSITISNYLASGGSVDTDMAKAIEAATGRPFDAGFAKSYAERSMDEWLKSDVARGYMAAASLVSADGEPLTEQQVAVIAYENFARDQDNAQRLERARNGDALSWQTDGKYGASGVLDAFDTGFISTLRMMSGAGYAPTDEDVDAISRELDYLESSTLNRSQFAATDEQWKPVQDRIASVRTLLEAYKAAPDKDWVTQVLVDSLDSPDKLGELAAFLDVNPSVFNYEAVAQGGIPDLTGLVSAAEDYIKNQKLIKSEFDAEEFAAKSADQGVMPGMVELEPEQMKSAYDNMSDEALVGAAKNLAFGISSNSADLSNPANAAAVGEHVRGFGHLLYNLDDTLDSTSFATYFGPESPLMTNLAGYVATDDAGVGAAQATLRTGLLKYQSTVDAMIASIDGQLAERKSNGVPAFYRDGNTMYWKPSDEPAQIGPDGEPLPEFGVEVTWNGEKWMSASVLEAGREFVALGRIGFSNTAKELSDLLNQQPMINSALTALENPEGAVVGAAAVSLVTANVPKEVMADTSFIASVNDVSDRLNINSGDLLRIIEFETAGSWAPNVEAPGTRATGLIQFIPSTAEGLGTSVEELAKMSRTEQMKYVEDYLKPYAGRIKNFGDLYMAIHYPKAIGKDDQFVLYAEGTDAYKFNKSLDTNGDGAVTRGEAVARVYGATGTGRMTTPRTGAGATEVQEAVGNLPPSAPMSFVGGPEQPDSLIPEGAPPGDVSTPDEEVSRIRPTGLERSAEDQPTPQTNKDVVALVSTLTGTDKEWAETQGVGMDAPIFKDQVSLERAIADGTLRSGDKVLVQIGGELVAIEVN